MFKQKVFVLIVLILCILVTNISSGTIRSNTADIEMGYQSKLSPDTLKDYLPYGKIDFKKYFEIYNSLPSPELSNFTVLISLLKKYQKESQLNPGIYEEGNLLLGGSPKDYRPSGSELITAEIGQRLIQIFKNTEEIIMREYLKRNKFKNEKIEYYYFTFSHVDAMGSGRFYYSSEPIKRVIIL